MAELLPRRPIPARNVPDRVLPDLRTALGGEIAGISDAFGCCGRLVRAQQAEPYFPRLVRELVNLQVHRVVGSWATTRTQPVLLRPTARCVASGSNPSFRTAIRRRDVGLDPSVGVISREAVAWLTLATDAIHQPRVPQFASVAYPYGPITALLSTDSCTNALDSVSTKPYLRTSRSMFCEPRCGRGSST